MATSVLRSPGRGERHRVDGTFRCDDSHAVPARLALVVLALALAWGATVAAAGAAPVPLAQLVGARLVVGMNGTMPSAGLLERIRSGRVGGVILMGANVRTAPQVRALTASLRAAARSGGRRILIATDQEGGLVRRFRWAPPAASAEELGRLTEGAIRRRGRETAAALEQPRRRRRSRARRRRARRSRVVHRRPAPRVLDAAHACREGGDGIRRRSARRRCRPPSSTFPASGSRRCRPTTTRSRSTPAQPALAPGLVPYRRAIAAGVAPW